MSDINTLPRRDHQIPTGFDIDVGIFPSDSTYAMKSKAAAYKELTTSSPFQVGQEIDHD